MSPAETVATGSLLLAAPIAADTAVVPTPTPEATPAP